MAHFAKLSEENVVLSIEVVADADTLKDGVEDEATGVAFLQSIHGWTNWKKCSYNTRNGVHYASDGTESSDQTKAFRKNYPHIGWTYDSVNDAFVSPKPFSSWVLNTTTGEWEAPVDYPSTVSSTDDPPINIHVSWDETNLRWVGVDTRDPIGNWRWDATNTVWVAL